MIEFFLPSTWIAFYDDNKYLKVYYTLMSSLLSFYF